MTTAGDPDYTKCSLEELIDVQDRIDRAAYRDRAAALDKEIARRLAARPGEAGPPGGGTVGVRLDEPIAFKPGRAMSMKNAVGAICGAVLGVAFVVYGIVKGFEEGWLLMVFGGVFVVISATDVAYHLFNAFQRHRFSDKDLVARNQEPDPFARSLGLEDGFPASQRGPVRRFPGGFCPFCGARAPENADRCPSCGKDV